MDSQRLDHGRTVIWDPGIVDSRVLSVCYDCLGLMALFRAVMSLVHHWAEWSVWTVGILADEDRKVAEMSLLVIHPCLTKKIRSEGNKYRPRYGCCRTIAWEERYLPRLHPPCVVDRLCGYITRIKVPGFVLMLNRDRNISTRRCACMRGTSLGVLSAGRISLMLSGCFAFGGGLVDCSDWPCVCCAVDFSPGGVWIGYIRQVLWDR